MAGGFDDEFVKAGGTSDWSKSLLGGAWGWFWVSWVALGGGGRCWASWGVMLGLLGGSWMWFLSRRSNMEFLSSTQRNGAVASVLGP